MINIFNISLSKHVRYNVLFRDQSFPFREYGDSNRFLLSGQKPNHTLWCISMPRSYRSQQRITKCHCTAQPRALTPLQRQARPDQLRASQSCYPANPDHLQSRACAGLHFVTLHGVTKVSCSHKIVCGWYIQSLVWQRRLVISDDRARLACEPCSMLS